MHKTNEPVMERISNNRIDGWTRLGRAECSDEELVQRKAGEVAHFCSCTFSRYCAKILRTNKPMQSDCSQHLPHLRSRVSVLHQLPSQSSVMVKHTGQHMHVTSSW